MKKNRFWIAITIIFLATACSPQLASPTEPPLPINTLTETPTIPPTPTIPLKSTSTTVTAPTQDLTYAYEATHRTPVDQIPYSLDCQQNGGFIRCHDILLGMSFEYSQSLWNDIQPKLEWGGYNGYEYEYFAGLSPDWPIAGGRSEIYSEGREPIIFDFGARDTADTRETICHWFSASACIEVKPNVYLAIMSSDGTQCESIPFSMYWGWWYPAAVVAIKLPEQSIINAFTFNTDFLTTEDLAKPYGFLNITDTAPPNCEPENIEKYTQFFLDLINGHWDKVSGEAREKFEQIAHLADSIEFDK